MKNFLHFRNSIILLFITHHLSAQTIYYVTPSGTGTGTGSWSNAAGSTSLQTILNAAPAGSQVWVARGTYFPNAYPPGSTGGASPRDYAFGLPLRVAVYGGFAGMETALAQRNPVANPTILSGEIGTSAVTDNCYHVVLAYGGNTGPAIVSILDGFTIQGGNANGSGPIIYDGNFVDRGFGGGMNLGYSNLIITHCIITGNNASEGAGISSVAGVITISHTQINFNVATSQGGGIIFSGGGNFVVSSCPITNNTAYLGGGIYNNGGGGIFSDDDISYNTANSTDGVMGGGGVCNVFASPTMIACIFNGNQTSGGTDGGAIYNNSSNTVDSGCFFNGNMAMAGNGGAIYNNGGNFQSWNCVFTGNGSRRFGGAIYIATGSNTKIVNSSIVDNTAALNSVDPSNGTGGGIYVASGMASGNPILSNNIIWDNSSGLVVVAGSPTVQYNDIQGGIHPGIGNISANPTFVDESNPIGTDGVWGTADDGLQLINGPTASLVSPAINTGTNGVGESINYDIMYVPRPVGAGIDMGAYEAPLPSTLALPPMLNFTAAFSGPKAALIQWQVDATNQAVAYEVQKSTDGKAFDGIGTLTAVKDRTEYSFADERAGSGNIFYRLKCIGVNNTLQYSIQVVIKRPPIPGALSLHPSVVDQGYTYLVVESPSASSVNISIHDASGHLYKAQTIPLAQGDNKIFLDLASFPGGVYYLNVRRENGLQKVVGFIKL